MIYVEKKDLLIMNQQDISKEVLWKIFIENPYQVIYIADLSTGVLDGIISLGDYVRFCRGNNSCINSEYICLIFDEVPLENQAKEIFEKSSHCNRLPVVDTSKRLLGEYRREQKYVGGRL